MRRTDATPENATDRRRWTLTYVRANAFEFWIAVASVIAAITFFTEPEALIATSVGDQAQGWVWAWNASYCAGGLLVVAGLLWPSPRFELAGLSLLASAVTVNATAVASVHGVMGVATIVSSYGLAIAAGMRAHLVWRIAKAAGRLEGAA